MTDAFGPGRQLLLGLVVFLIGAGVAVVAGRDDADLPAAVGPDPGTRLDAYAAERREALAEADGTVRAVVSFDAYLTPDAARDLAGGDVATFLVAAPGAEPEVTDDPGSWARERGGRAREEAAQFESLIPTVEDPDFERQYRQDLDRARRTAAALEAGEPVVFAVVVRGPAASLRTLARAEGVRLVDPVEDDAVGPPRGLRPEERSMAGQPPERP